MLATLAATALVVVTGCGDGKDDKRAYTGTPGQEVPVRFSKQAGAVPLSTKPTKLGELLAGQADRTLYTYVTDSGRPIDCRAQCAWTWIPVVVLQGVNVRGGVSRSKVGAVTYSKKANQLTYGGHPLYFYASDDGAASVKGNGKKGYGATWLAVKADGSLAR